MSLFHHHQWTDVSCTYTPPSNQNYGDAQSEGRTATGQLIEMVREAGMGRTNIVQRCSECGLITSHSFIGQGTL